MLLEIIKKLTNLPFQAGGLLVEGATGLDLITAFKQLIMKPLVKAMGPGGGSLDVRDDERRSNKAESFVDSSGNFRRR